MRLKLARAANDEEGATLVEMALVCIVMIAIFFGIFEFSLGFYTYNFISQAAREGSRYAIVRGSQSCQNTPTLSACNAKQADIQAYVQGLTYPGVDPTKLVVTATWPTTGASCFPSATPCNNPGNLVQLTVTYPFPLSIPFWRSTTVNISSTSSMVISQ